MLRLLLLSTFFIFVLEDSFANKKLNSYPTPQQKFVDTIFIKSSNNSLIADELALLNPQELIKKISDVLSLNIGISAITYHQHQLYFNSLPQQLIFYSEANLKERQAGLYMMMAVTETLAGDLNIAYHHFNKALILYQMQLNHAKVAQIASFLYQLAVIFGEDKAAADYNTIALAGFRISQNDKSYINALLQQNQLWLKAGYFKQAEQQILTKTLLIAYKLNSKQAEIDCYMQLGRIYLFQNKFTEAKWFFVQANILANKIQQQEGIIRSLLMLAKVKNKIKDHHLALADLQKAERLINQQNERFQFDVLKNLAITYFKLGSKEKAEIYSVIYNKEHESYVNSITYR
ncbi:tetratricopeptide repeat protein [Pedobacter glucosidilyticus]|uniref:tetratricopeptide repeat protein n=1 Tax=Pedobacter glucosidilyticus TaxID=1122941 RepID=UPI0026EA2D19|nr:hypothetical protein [Pedobacter glucosidilyticus]